MVSQISLTDHLAQLEKEEEREYSRKVDYVTTVPFQFVVFRKAYRILKDKGKISRVDILEFEVSTVYEVYESLYLKALNSVFRYCREQTEKENLVGILCNAYEKEFDWMRKRWNLKYPQKVSGS